MRFILNCDFNRGTSVKSHRFHHQNQQAPVINLNLPSSKNLCPLSLFGKTKILIKRIKKNTSVEKLLQGRKIIFSYTIRVMEGGLSATGEEWKKWY